MLRLCSCGQVQIIIQNMSSPIPVCWGSGRDWFKILKKKERGKQNLLNIILFIPYDCLFLLSLISAYFNGLVLAEVKPIKIQSFPYCKVFCPLQPASAAGLFSINPDTHTLALQNTELCISTNLSSCTTMWRFTARWEETVERDCK